MPVNKASILVLISISKCSSVKILISTKAGFTTSAKVKELNNKREKNKLLNKFFIILKLISWLSFREVVG